LAPKEFEVFIPPKDCVAPPKPDFAPNPVAVGGVPVDDFDMKDDVEF
jgi:hypothetical protein